MSHISRLADVLSFAAAPTFAILTVANGIDESLGPGMLCSGGSNFGSMTMMYLVMSAFHLAPWLKLIARAVPAIQGGDQAKVE